MIFLPLMHISIEGFLDRMTKIKKTDFQYFATTGIFLPSPNDFEDTRNMGGAWYLLYSL